MSEKKKAKEAQTEGRKGEEEGGFNFTPIVEGREPYLHATGPDRGNNPANIDYSHKHSDRTLS